MNLDHQQLSIIGDVGVDLVLGTLAAWPQIGTEQFMPCSELRAGGSAANSALAARHVGLRVHLISAIGNDHFGSWLVDQFNGIVADFEACSAETTLSVGLMHDGGERNFFTTQGHLRQFSAEYAKHHLREAAGDAIALFTGPFLLQGLRRDYCGLLADAAAKGYQVALDTGWPPEGWKAEVRAEVRTWLGYCDHLLINELEACNIAGVGDADEAMRLISEWIKPGGSVVMKRGAKGAVAMRHGCFSEHVSQPVPIFDTIGAGDAFNTGYLGACLLGADMAECLASGCNTALAVLSHFPRKTIRAGELRSCLASPRRVETTT